MIIWALGMEAVVNGKPMEFQGFGAVGSGELWTAGRQTGSSPGLAIKFRTCPFPVKMRWLPEIRFRGHRVNKIGCHRSFWFWTEKAVR